MQLVLDDELLERVPLRSWDIARLGVHEGDRRVCELRVVAHLLWLQFEQAQQAISASRCYSDAWGVVDPIRNPLARLFEQAPLI